MRQKKKGRRKFNPAKFERTKQKLGIPNTVTEELVPQLYPVFLKPRMTPAFAPKDWPHRLIPLSFSAEVGAKVYATDESRIDWTCWGR